MPDTSISLLIRLQQAPCSEDWQKLHAIYKPLLQLWISRAGVPPQEADDLVQEVMLVLVQQIHQFQHRQAGSFRAWLRSILSHRLLGFYRTRKWHAPGGSDFQQVLQDWQDSASPLSQLWDQEHDRLVLQRILQYVERDFTRETWQAFRLQVLEQVPAREAAIRTGLSFNSVLLAKSRVLKRLRQESEGFVAICSE